MPRAKRERNSMSAITLRAGVMMRPRNPAQRPERAKRDHTVLALPTTCPGGESGWSFLRGGPLKEAWFVLADDVAPEDFCDSPHYLDTQR